MRDYLPETFPLSSSLESSGQTDSTFINMSAYMTICGLAGLAIAVVGLLMMATKGHPKIVLLWEAIKNDMRWNNVIRFISIVYLESVIQFSIFMQTATWYRVTWAIILLAALVAWPAFSGLWLHFNRADLDEGLFRAKYETMYMNISLMRSAWSILYHMAFCIRRFFFVMIPLFFLGKPYLQLQMLLFFNSLYVIWYAAEVPHNEKRITWVETANECLFMILVYHMLSFTAFAEDVDSQYTMGASYLVFLGIMILINLINTIYVLLEQCRRKQYLWAAKKLREAQWREEQMNMGHLNMLRQHLKIAKMQQG